MGSDATRKPNNYLILSIVATVLGNIILGIVAIIKSSQVDAKWDEGDYDGARASSESAKRWAISAIVVASIIYVIAIIKMFLLLYLKFNLIETFITTISELHK